MFKRILVAVDGSDTATKAVVSALQLARDTGGRVRLLHVMDERPLVSGFDMYGGYSGDLVAATGQVNALPQPKEHLMNHATDSLNKGQARLAHDFDALLHDAQDLLRHAGEETGKGYLDARGRLEKSIRTARKELGNMEDRVLDATRLAGRSAGAYVRKHPWEAIGFGAAAAILVAILVARR